MAKGGWLRRLFGGLLRALAWAVVAFVLLSAGSVLALRYVNPPISAFMIEAELHSWFDADPQPYRLRHAWRDLAAISPQAAIAVVASEDQQFPFHSGFDVDQIRRAVADARRGRAARGASTISQQVAKNLFLWPGHSFVRKGLEAYFTVLMEALWSKHRIIEVYLNIAQFGRGLYGVQSAARAYFATDARALSESQAALLAAVLPNPIRLRVDRPSRYLQYRAHAIQAQMQQLGGTHYLQGIY